MSTKKQLSDSLIKRRWRVLVMCLLLICSMSWLAQGQPPSLSPSQRVKGRWEVHEWGTFTSTQSSDGRLMDGMHHGEEPLPRFVYERSPNSIYGGKGLSVGAPPKGVTQRLETPVIYFYTDRPRQIQVKVDFPKGIISQWYPMASRFSPPLHKTSRLGWIPKKGSMTWKGLTKPGPGRLSRVKPTSIWFPSRQVPEAANFYAQGRHKKRGTDVERFIFYRGVGRFRSWVKVTSRKARAGSNATWTIHNGSDDIVPEGIVLNVTKHGGSWRRFGAIKGRGRIPVKAPGEAQHRGIFLRGVKAALVKMLVRSGLTKAESWAMVDTWHTSYFRLPGKRVLYIVPRAWTDRLLPITITPRPKKLVRTLVGRIEYLTPHEEQTLVSRFTRFYKRHLKAYKKAMKTIESSRKSYRKLIKNARTEAQRKAFARLLKVLRPNVYTLAYKMQRTLGRLTEPKLRRIHELLKDQKQRIFCQDLLRHIGKM